MLLLVVLIPAGTGSTKIKWQKVKLDERDDSVS